MMPPCGLLDRFAGCPMRIPSPAKSVRRRAFLRRLECNFEHVADLLGVDELELAELLLGDLLDVALVALGDDHALDPGPLGGERLLLQAPDRQDLACKRDLA